MGLSVLHSSPFYLPTKKKLCPYLAFVLIWVIFELDNGIDSVTLFAFFPIWVIFELNVGIDFVTLFAFFLIWVIFLLEDRINFVTLFAFFPIWVIFVLDDGIEFMTLFVTKTNRVIDYNNVFSFINLNLEKTNK